MSTLSHQLPWTRILTISLYLAKEQKITEQKRTGSVIWSAYGHLLKKYCIPLFYIKNQCFIAFQIIKKDNLRYILMVCNIVIVML